MAEIIITSSVLIFVLLVLRRVCWGKISRRLQYGLWLLVVIRLLVPPQLFTSSLSVMNAIDHAGEAISERVQELNDVNHDSEQAKDSESTQITDDVADDTRLQAEHTEEYSGAGEADQHVKDQIWSGDDVRAESGRQDSMVSNKAEVEKKITLAEIVRMIYVAGIIVVGCSFFVCNLRFRRRLASERQLIDRDGRLKVYLAAHLQSPCLCGIFVPAIYINEKGLASEERKEYILLHEKTHYMHWDHVWAMIRSLCIILYWFHPLVWVAAMASMQDSELACDEGTLSKLGEEHRHAYGSTLIEMMADKVSTGRVLYCSTGMVNGKEEIKKRITMLADYRKQMIWTAVLVVVFALLLSACTAGAAQKTPESEEVLQSGDTKQEADRQEPDAEETVIFNDDGSIRLSEYEVDLTADKVEDKIVFDVRYRTDLGAKEELTEELLWEKLWDGAEISVKILEGGKQNTDDGEKVIFGNVLEEYSFSSIHAGNGNLAVMKYERIMCVLLYGNEVYQDRGRFWYQVWQIMPSGSEPVLREEKEVEYVTPSLGSNEESVIEQLTEVESKLDYFFMLPSTETLISASGNRDVCYLYREKAAEERGRQYAMDVFMAEVEGTGFELKLRDYFYPGGMESLTRLPEDAEQQILAGEILCMEVSQENNTAGRLDLDGDGVKEVLYLDSIGHSIREDGWSDWGDMGIRYRLRVDDQYYEGYCSHMDPVLMAYSPDGENILLALYDDGPSNDPETLFFRYYETGVHPAGRITSDLRTATVDDQGLIHSRLRVDVMQTEYVECFYHWNGSEIVLREDEIYHFIVNEKWREENPMVLLTEITVYEERSEESTALVMKPQEVINVATDRKEWVLLEAEDGTRGWIRVVGLKIPSLGDKAVYEVFEGLIFAD